MFAVFRLLMSRDEGSGVGCGLESSICTHKTHLATKCLCTYKTEQHVHVQNASLLIAVILAKLPSKQSKMTGKAYRGKVGPGGPFAEKQTGR